MKILVTAGNTQAPIDKVRCLTNIFTGRTGAAIAAAGQQRGHEVTLLTSHPEVAVEMVGPRRDRWHVEPFVTFADLHNLLADRVLRGKPDAVIHCAAVSDYQAGGIYAPAPGTRFQPDRDVWEAENSASPRMEDRSAGKVKSDEPELWLRLVRTPKLVDYFRGDWKFAGVLVKFKLEVGVRDDQLLDIAERSRLQSGADLMVANTLEGAATYAFLGPLGSGYERVSRRALPQRLIKEVERKYQERTHG